MGLESRYQSVLHEPNSLSLTAWMSLAASDIGGYEWISKDDLKQRFSLSPYVRMYEVENVGEDELQDRFYHDAITYVEESVLRLKLGERNFQLRNGDMFSDDFGNKSILTMCRDTVVARQKNGIDPERAKHEGLGFANLIKLLEVMSPGNVAVLVSPPDNNDQNMSEYSMAYLYEKREDGEIWFGAVRDEKRSIADWREFAKENSLWQTDWTQFDHLKFVALPFVIKDSLGQILKTLGVGYVSEVPGWIKREAQSCAKLIAENIISGDLDMSHRVLNSFKLAVIAGRKMQIEDEEGYRVQEMIWDPMYLVAVQNGFNMTGGREILEAGGLCGVEDLSGLLGRSANPLERLKQDNNGLSSVMGIIESSAVETNSDKPEGVISELHHVGCPLCGDCDVTAYITATHIHCSKCKKSKRLS